MKPFNTFKTIPDRKQELIDLNNLFDLPNRQDKDYITTWIQCLKT